VKTIFEKFRCIGDLYNIRIVFKTEHTLKNSLMRTRLERTPQHTSSCIFGISCECGRSYTDDAGTPLAVLLWERGHNLERVF
jgi:hypothetical protein